MTQAPRDQNRVTTLIGTSSVDLSTPEIVGVDPTTHELLVKATLSSDVQIGAVEIKDGTTDQRAVVNGFGYLMVDGSGATQPVTGTVAVSSSVNKYATNAIDDYTTASTTYICKEDSSTADWWFIKIDETGNFPVFTHATVLNNATKTTFALAYADRTTLTYGAYNTAF